jgi:hypothetical protein
MSILHAISFKWRKLLFFFAILVLFFVSAFRSEVGLDEESYRQIYKQVSFDIANNGFSFFSYLQEPLYILLNIFLSPLRSDQSIFLFFASANAILMYVSYKKLTNCAVLPILIYYSHRFLHNDLNQIRQGLVSLIFLYGLLSINNKRYYLYNIISLFIQSSSFIFFIFKPVEKYFAKPFNVIVVLIFVFFFSTLINLDAVFNLLPETSKILFYLQDERFNYSRNLFSDFTFLKSLLILSFMIFKYNSLEKMWTYFPLLFSTYTFGIFVMILFQKIAIFSGRISTLFFTVEPIIIYYLAINYSFQFNKKLLYIFVYFFAFFNLYLNLNAELSPVKTYKSIFIK